MNSLFSSTHLLVVAVGAASLAAIAGDGTNDFRTKFDREVTSGRPSLICTRVAKGPVIDGEVDKDPVWQSCARTQGAWTQLAKGEVSGRQTVVYSCFDNENLYFGFVCEEPELQNVQMDGNITGQTSAGTDDCVEAVIEVGGTQGDGQLYSFRANSRTHSESWGFTGIPQEVYKPVWKSAGKFGPNRWMAELAIPFESLKRRSQDKGLTTPARGEVFGLKLVRWGAQQQDTRNRMVSTWNTNIIYPFVYICGGDGLLYFEDSSALRDGNLTSAPAESPWKSSGQAEAIAGGGVSLGPGASLSQTAQVRPKSYYLLSIDGEGAFEMQLNGKKLTLKSGKAGFWTGEKDQAQIGVVASGAARLRKIAMQYQPAEEPEGAYCLTNNYRHSERNIKTLKPDAPEGSYRYVALDYKNDFEREDHPIFGKIRGLPEGKDANSIIEDIGGTSGWIPFNKGSLTLGKPHIVLWNFRATPEPGVIFNGLHDQVVELDLGCEYFVHGLDVLWAGPYYNDIEVWGKLKAEDEWTFLYLHNGQFVNPATRRPDLRGYDQMRGLDSVVRYLRWCGRQSAEFKGQRSNWNGQGIAIDGIQAMRVWGEPKGERSGIMPFQPWILNEGAKPLKWTTTAPDPDICQIVPRPRKMEKENGWFIIGPQTRIVAQPMAEAMKDAEQVRDEIRERWEIDVPIVPEANDSAALEDAIYLGQLNLTRIPEHLLQQEALQSEFKPQGYVLRVAPKRIVAIGHDAAGLYWAVQSLMLAMRWHHSNEPQHSGLGVRCMKLEDWPATLDRCVLNTEGKMFDCLESELPRFIRNYQLLSRFKWNAAYDPDSHFSGKCSAWPPGRAAELCQQVRQSCHVELRPMLLGYPKCAPAGWGQVAGNNYSVEEADPDETATALGAALNLCPVNPQTYVLLNAKLDEMLFGFGNPSKIWLGGLPWLVEPSGSRWAVCRACKQSGKTKEELCAFFARQVAQHLAERDTTGVLEPYNVAFGDKDSERWKRATVVADVRELPPGFEYILPEDASPRFKEFINTTLVPGRTANGPADWPSAERLYEGGCLSDLGTEIATAMPQKSLACEADRMWNGKSPDPARNFDFADLRVWLNCWRFRRDFPSWRAGDRPQFFPIDLRPFVNHSGHPTGRETLEPGRPPPIDLRNLPSGKQVLSGVEFELIDPAKNDGKSLLMLGRPLLGVTHAKDAAEVMETAGPIPVGRKLASLAFLRAGWQASLNGLHFSECWLSPICRVVYDDDTWLPVDCFRRFDGQDYWNSTLNVNYSSHLNILEERTGWCGNSPSGFGVLLCVREWVNPYPSKVIKNLQFFTPAFEDGAGQKRPNQQCEAVVAISGVEPIEQDFNYWSKHANPPPLLPPLKAPACAAAELQRVGDVGGADARYAAKLKGPSGGSLSTLDLPPAPA